MSAQLDEVLAKSGQKPVTVTPQMWVLFGVLALAVQAVPMYFFHAVRELYAQDFILLYVAMAIVGAVLLAYSFAKATIVRARKMARSGAKTAGIVSEATAYGIFFANLVYLLTYTALLKLVSFDNLIINGMACVTLAGLVSAAVCVYDSR